ncbi:hypothetical protein F2Q70_00006286 [Brassica cretica]|uniref:Uncharacterized protein n=1 Tax=Brassica cretica TaxID=69181 RepID=A0A8S9INE4_BRACR|nr:hypothetical protein F2Q70_00006286 [Brassica cretica]
MSELGSGTPWAEADRGRELEQMREQEMRSGFRVRRIAGYVTTNFFPWICWNLWSARNLLAFENRTLSPQEIVLKSIRASKEWEAAQPGNLSNLSRRSIKEMKQRRYCR